MFSSLFVIKHDPECKSVAHLCRKMKGLVTSKKLRDIAVTQRREIAALGGKLDRLYLRSFPSFLDVSMARQPDEA